MDRRTFLRTVAGAAGALVLESCSKSLDVGNIITTTTLGPAPPPGELAPRARPTLRLAGGDVGLPSPFRLANPAAYFVMTYLYDSLLWTDSTGALIPWLAARHESSPDGMVHTFELRDGLRWSDGRPFTPEDVVFSFQYLAVHQANLIPPPLFPVENVADVRPLGARGVQIHLDKPAVTFAQNVAGRVPILPRHVWSRFPEPFAARDLAVLVSTGPYRLDSYTEGDGSYLFTANDQFFLGRPFVQRIELRPVGDELAALSAGEIDAGGQAATGLPPAALQRFVKDPAFGLISGHPDFLFALYWNLGRGGGLGDVRFRHACALAIDRGEMVKRLTGGTGEVGNPGFLPKGHPYRVDVEQYAFDPGAAERLLDQAGYRRRGNKGARRGPNGQPLRLSLLALPITAQVAELVVQDLAGVGLEVEISPTDLLFPALSAGEFDMAISIYGGHAGDPDLMRRVYSSRVNKGFQAARGYINGELDDLADRQLVTTDTTERARLVGRMQQIVAADLPLLHLYYPRPFLIYRKEVLDQVSYERGGLGPLNKQALVTGVRSGGTEIRPIA